MWSPSPAEWGRLEPLVDQLLDLPPQERSDFIERSFSSSPELRLWVERLVAASEDPDWMSAVSPVILAGAFAIESGVAEGVVEEPAGARFGPFRVVRELGRGGMGLVYLGEREEGGFEQRVAIKVVQSAFASAALRRRFLAEQQILARLEHPNVARLVDGGIRADGVAWFAMEYVEGERLDAWCDARRLDTKARLHLFLSVCDAVQAAHQRLVIHRDLKPSNILVDAQGKARLLDFGIAKLLEAGQYEASDATEAGDRAFTPEYAAPEQWRQEPVTTATDCYSLGVMLYQLLSGARPINFHGRPRTEWLRLVLDTTPHPPSAMVTPDAAARRGTSAERLRHQLRGDLDAIVATAMHADPTDRYSTVRQLGDDITRYLQGLPVTARRDTWTYRTSRFVRRNRVAVASAAAVLLTMVGGSVATLWQARRASEAADEASAVSSFLTAMFREASPLQARGDSLTAGQLLERAASTLDTAFAGRPELRIRLLLTVAEINRDLASLDKAEALIRRAVAAADSLPRMTASVVASRAMLAEILRARGQLPAADSLFIDAIALARRIGSPDTTLARLIDARVHVLYRQQKFPEAEAAAREAFSLGSDLDPVFRGSAANNLALTLDENGKGPAADSANALALSIFRSAGQTGHPDYIMALGNRGTMFEERWELDSGRVLKEEVLRHFERIYPQGHDRVIIARSNHAYSYLNLGMAAVAESGFTIANTLANRLHGPAHPLAVVTRTNIGRAQLRAGQPVRAESTFRGVIADVRAGLGDDHPSASMGRLGLAMALGAQRRAREALAALDTSLAIAQRSLPPTHPRTADIAFERAKILLAAGRLAEASAAARAAWTWRREHLNERDPGVAEVGFLLARSLAQATAVPAKSERDEIEMLCADAASRFARFEFRARERAEVDSALRVWRQSWNRPG